MICTICSKNLTKLTKSQTCSRRCNAIYQNKEKGKKFIPNKCKQCGEEVKIRQSKVIFCSSTCQGKFNSGENHYNWKGGKKLHGEGYVYVCIKTHPKTKNGYILEHRLITEDILLQKEDNQFLQDGYLKDEVVVHHINHDKRDNRPSNLYVCKNQQEHMLIHKLKMSPKSNLL